MAMKHALGLSGIALLMLTMAQAQGDDEQPGGLDECRNITDSLERLACYDGIGETEGRAEAKATAPELEAPDTVLDNKEPTDQETADSTEQASEYAALTDDVGLPQAADANKPILVKVDRCGEANNRRFYFYFDNGQVWKYLGSKKLRYRGCDASARLVEDKFGFTLQMDGDSAKHRVQRVK
jgi:hypothetical protein